MRVEVYTWNITHAGIHNIHALIHTSYTTTQVCCIRGNERQLTAIPDGPMDSYNHRLLPKMARPE